MKNGVPIACDVESIGAYTTTSMGEQGLTMARMVDWCLGLELNKEDKRDIHKAFETMEDDDCSLNQSRSFIKAWPLILDLEIKKTLSNRDPQVQLAIWASAALIKRRRFGWDTSFPMPAIAINGSEWDYYLFYEMDRDLVCWLVLYTILCKSANYLGLDNDGPLAHGLHERFERAMADSPSTPHSHRMGQK